MDEERIERARRNFRYSHTEPDPPSTLREHLDELAEAGGPMAVSGPAVVEHVDPRVPSDALSRHSPARTIAAIGAVVVTALVGGGLILGLAIRPNPLLTGLPTPIPSSGTSGSPTLPPASAVPSGTGTGSFTWTLVSSTEGRATYAIGDAIPRAGGGWIGVAFGQEARTVHSEDGVRWILDPADPGLLAAPPDHLTLTNGLANGAHGLVAVGASALFDISSGLVRAWTSTDGLHWKAASEIGGDSNAAMEAVVAGPDGYVAVGSDGFPGGNVQLPGAHGAATWSTMDGARWVRAPDQPSFAGAIMTGVARTGNGYVAWGQILPMAGGPATQPPIWTSTDGRTWTRANGSSVAHDVFFPLGGIIVEPDRWVAVGTRRASEADGGGFHAGAWVSIDSGSTWTAAAIDGSTSGTSPSGYVHDVAAVGTDLLAIGHVEPNEPTSDDTTAAVWRSTDHGATWTRLPADPSFRGALMDGILPLDENRFVVFGQANDPNALVNPNLIWLATRRP